MKPISTVAVCVLVALTVIGVFGQTSNAKKAQGETSVDSIFIEVGQKQWSIRELNAKCTDRLKKEPEWPKDGKIDVVVNITPKNSEIMCEFGFYQHFSDPSWLVEVDYAGEIKRVTKQKVGEGKRR